MIGFNIRVYGIFITPKGKLLLSEEKNNDIKYTKFIGGGVEFGEGLIDALKREFLEECGCEIEILNHFYTTDFFIKSAFDNKQLLAIYYLIKPISERFKFKSTESQVFKYVDLRNIDDSVVTFPIDKHVINLLIKNNE